MSILNTPGFLDLAKSTLESAPEYISLFDGIHSVIVSRMAIWIYLTAFLSVVIKNISDPVLGGNSETRANQFLGVGLIAILLFPVKADTNGAQFLISKNGGPEENQQAMGYFLAKKLIKGYIYLAEMSYSSILQSGTAHFKIEPLIAMYQSDRVELIASAMQTGDILAPYANMRSMCSNTLDTIANSVEEGSQLTDEQLTVRMAASSLLNQNKIYLGYENTTEEIFESILSSNLDFDVIKEAFKKVDFTPAIGSLESVNVINPIWLKGELINATSYQVDTNEISKFMPSKLSLKEAGSKPFYGIDLVTNSNEAYQEGMSEYIEYINERANESLITDEVSSVLTDISAPLGVPSQEVAAKLIPIDCLSSIMIANIAYGQIGYAVGAPDIIFQENTSEEDIRNTNFISRMAAVELAMESVTQSYREHGESDIMRIIDKGLAIISTTSETVTKVKEGYEMDVIAPVIIASLILSIGFILCITPLILPISLLLPQGWEFLFQVGKLVLFALTSVVLMLFSMMYIENQIKSAVASWMALNTSIDMGALYVYDKGIMSSITSGEVRSAGSQTLASVVLAANESSKWLVTASLLISYGLFWDYKHLFMNFGSTTSLGNAYSKSLGKAIDGIGKAVRVLILRR